MYSKANWHFGAGRLTFIGEDGTPIRCATLQGIDIDISASTKELMGENQFPEAMARTGMKITGKVQTGRFDGRVISKLFLGASEQKGNQTSDLLVPVDNERHTAGADGTVALDLAGGAFDTDLGVIDAATGNAYRYVAPGTGFAPAAGEYTFDASTDAYQFAAPGGQKVLLSYIKSVPDAGEITTITNDLMGEGPVFEITTFDNRGLFLQLYRCQFNKLSIQRKNEDFMIPNLEFSASADDVRGVGRLSIARGFTQKLRTA